MGKHLLFVASQKSSSPFSFLGHRFGWRGWAEEYKDKMKGLKYNRKRK